MSKCYREIAECGAGISGSQGDQRIQPQISSRVYPWNAAKVSLT